MAAQNLHSNCQLKIVVLKERGLCLSLQWKYPGGNSSANVVRKCLSLKEPRQFHVSFETATVNISILTGTTNCIQYAGAKLPAAISVVIK